MAHRSKEEADAYFKQYRERNRETIREKDRLFRQANKERLNATAREHRLKNLDVIKARQKAYRDSDAGKAYNKRYVARYLEEPTQRLAFLAKGAVRRAKKRGLPYEVEIIQYLSATPPKSCLCCGKTLNYSMGKGINNRDDSPSIDRFECARGYTVENVRIICMRCNDIKRDADVSEIQTILRYMLIADRDHVSAQLILAKALPSSINVEVFDSCVA